MSKELLDIQATTECSFTVKRLFDMIRTHCFTFAVLQTSGNFEPDDMLTICHIGLVNISGQSSSILQVFHLDHKIFQGQHYLIF